MNVDELAAHLADHPDDVDTATVLADHLQNLGDPRGELIALDLGLRKFTDASSAMGVAKRRTELRTLLAPPTLPNFETIVWGLGWVRKLAIRRRAATDMPAAIAALIAHPSMAHFVVLETSVPLSVFAATPPRSIRSLVMRSGADQEDQSFEVIANLPRLDQLTLGPDLARAELAHPTLRALQFGPRAAGAMLGRLSIDRLPSITTITSGIENYGDDDDVDGNELLDVVIDGGWFDRLKTLVLPVPRDRLNRLARALERHRLERLELVSAHRSEPDELVERFTPLCDKLVVRCIGD